jgi:hypothetical protein
MPKQKRANDQHTNIKVGNVSAISGNMNIAGGDITTHHTITSLSTAEIKQLFDHIHTAINSRVESPPAEKEDLKAEVDEIQSTIMAAANKNEKVDEGVLLRRFRSIARMAPDILDVVVATLVNPLAGLGVAAKKIAEKAKEQTGQV